MLFRHRKSALWVVSLAVTGAAFAGSAAPPALEGRGPGVSDQVAAVAAADPALARTQGDTLYLLGGPDRGDGKFQDDNDPLVPDDEGWVPLGQFDDGTGPYWQVSSFNAELLDPGTPDNRAVWCGKYFLPCAGEPENPGYDSGGAQWARGVSRPETVDML